MQAYPKKNRVIGVTAFGETEILKELEIELPPLEPTEILVENHALSLNPLDYKLKNAGLWLTGKASETTPFVLGCEGVGKVAAVGAEVKKFKEGDLVFYTYQGLYGSAAKYTVVDHRQAAQVPESLEIEEAAGVSVAFGTSIEAFVEVLGLSLKSSDNHNKTMLIIGGGGGVGSAAIQVAKALGLTVVATASRQETEKYARKMGADYVINHKNSLDEELKKLDGEVKGFDYVFNTADMTQDSFKKIAAVLNIFGAVCGIAGFNEPISIGAGFPKRAVWWMHELLLSDLELLSKLCNCPITFLQLLKKKISVISDLDVFIYIFLQRGLNVMKIDSQLFNCSLRSLIFLKKLFYQHFLFGDCLVTLLGTTLKMQLV